MKKFNAGEPPKNNDPLNLIETCFGKDGTGAIMDAVTTKTCGLNSTTGKYIQACPDEKKILVTAREYVRGGILQF